MVRRVGVRLVWLIVARMAVVQHRPLGGRVLYGRRRIRILHGVQHRVEDMRPDDNITRSNFGHGFLRGVPSLDLLPLRFLRFRPIALQNAIA